MTCGLPHATSGTDAEVVAFAVSQAVGLETNTASRDDTHPYGGDAETLAASLDATQRTAALIIREIQRSRVRVEFSLPPLERHLSLKRLPCRRSLFGALHTQHFRERHSMNRDGGSALDLQPGRRSRFGVRLRRAL